MFFHSRDIARIAPQISAHTRGAGTADGAGCEVVAPLPTLVLAQCCCSAEPVGTPQAAAESTDLRDALRSRKRKLHQLEMKMLQFLSNQLTAGTGLSARDCPIE